MREQVFFEVDPPGKFDTVYLVFVRQGGLEAFISNGIQAIAFVTRKAAEAWIEAAGVAGARAVAFPAYLAAYIIKNRVIGVKPIVTRPVKFRIGKARGNVH